MKLILTPEATLTEVTATSEKTSINLSYTVEGIGTITCVYGTDTNYESIASEVTNSKCSISNLNPDTMYYYKVCAKNATGEVCKEGSIKTEPNSTPFTQNDVGKYVSMTPTISSYKPSSSITGCQNDSDCTQNTINPSELNLWRVIKVNDDGTVEMVSHYVSSKNIYFRGKNGYLNFIGGLNTIASQYTDGVHVSSTRYMGYSTQIEKCTAVGSCPVDTGYETDTNLVITALGSLAANKVGTSTATEYWLASRTTGTDSDGTKRYRSRFINANGSITFANVYHIYTSGSNAGSSRQYAIRPIVTLKPNVEISSGSGTEISPYILN